MPSEKTSSLGDLTDEERDKILTMVAKLALTKHVRKKMKEREAKEAARAGQNQTNSASSPKPEKS